MSFRDRGDGWCARCGRTIDWHAGEQCFAPDATGMPAPEPLPGEWWQAYERRAPVPAPEPHPDQISLEV